MLQKRSVVQALGVRWIRMALPAAFPRQVAVRYPVERFILAAAIRIGYGVRYSARHPQNCFRAANIRHLSCDLPQPIESDHRAHGLVLVIHQPETVHLGDRVIEQRPNFLGPWWCVIRYSAVSTA